MVMQFDSTGQSENLLTELNTIECVSRRCPD